MPALGAGQRDRKATVERAGAPVVGPHGDETPGWTVLAIEWVSVRFGSSAERRQAAQTGANQAATFGFLWNTATRSITPADRLQFDDAVWNIQGVNVSPGNTGVVVAAVRAA
ncbi:head-tail adaptor protein [Sphingomonas sp.]|jgi:head-tail adaptor|uniref:head-tail adaptor protein n=1 Tax=Sphingomonas sp. TaxID=28214 RepID=UPI002D7E81C8|nr:head-tail adaptor protein [Sphingomonas sp.]HEU0045083.1 head-tail adaptor protein [Sphingomonas sp.]